MDKFILPPPPNWFLSNILACNDDGLLAYGSRSELPIVNYKSEGHYDVSLINFAHSEKINVVVFSPKNGKFNNCLATCGDDGMVKVWDYTNSVLLLRHSGHKDGVKVTGLDWSRVDTNRLVSVDYQGSIVVWDVASNTIRRLRCGVKVVPLCLACCPHDKDIISIGCKSGITLVFEIKGAGKLIHRLRCYEQDVISTSWCPVPYNVIQHKRGTKPVSEGNAKEVVIDRQKDLLLATGGSDILIWRAGSDGRYEVVLHSPTSSLSSNILRKKANPPTNTTMQWTSVLWVDAYTLLSSDQFGELLSWNLNNLYPNDKSKKPRPRLLHSNHNKGCFSIACPVIYDRVEDWKFDKRIVWTTAMDKHLIACSLSSSNIVLDIPTTGGAVYCMDSSPLDPSRMAIGSSDNKVLIWNINDISTVNITSYCRKIFGKVMALSWHPTEENLLAFGTSEGHVGLLELGSNKVPTLLRLHHRKAVYRLCWAPPLINANKNDFENNKAVLYSLGDGDIFQYTANLNQPDEEPKSLNIEVFNAIDTSQGLQKHPFRSDLAFKHDLSCFAVASDNGFVYVVECQTLTQKQVIYAHKKMINSVVWHPETVACDNNISPNKNWLATASDNIKVYNIHLDSPPELVANLTGHSMKTVCLTWSPYYNGMLLSSSYDTTVQLWDVPRQTCVGIYDDHSSAVLSALFNPLNPDLVISGSFDNTIRVWSISELSTTSSVMPNKRKHLRKITIDGRTDVTEASELTMDAEAKDQMCSRVKSHETSETGLVVSSKGKEDYKKKQDNQSIFMLTGPKLIQAKHFDVLLERFMSPESPNPAESTDKDQNSSSASDISYLDFFGDTAAMQNLLLAEENQHMDLKRYPLAHNAALWRGDVSNMIQDATIKKQLSPWLISMAPIAGFEVWEQACDAYASQLVEQGDLLTASTYLLATHKVHEAVRLLKDNFMYREAVAVAKSRLTANDPLISEVFNEWGMKSKQLGQLTLSAHCYLAANNTEACIAVLARGKDLKSLKMAAFLAKNIGQTDMAHSLAIECLTLCVMVCNYTVGQQLLVEMPQYQYWAVWLKASEVLTRVKNRTEVEVFGWLEGLRPGQPSLLQDLTAICSPQGNIYHQLLPHLPTNNTPHFDRDMWLYVSGHLAVACAAKVETSMANFLRHMVLAFSGAFHFQTTHPQSLALPIIISQIFPTGLFAEGSILLLKYEANEENLLMKSLKAFVCASIVHWMNNNWQKVENMCSKEETNFEMGGGDTSKEGPDYKMNWLVELFKNCIADVLDPESVSFFIKKAQKLNLESLIVNKNIRQKSINSNEKNQKTQKSKHNIALDNGTKQKIESMEVGKDITDNVSLESVEALIKTGVQFQAVETHALNKIDLNVAVIIDASEKTPKVEKETNDEEPTVPHSDFSVGEIVDTNKKIIDQNVAVIIDGPDKPPKVVEATNETELLVPPSVLPSKTKGEPEIKNLNTDNEISNKEANNFLELMPNTKNNTSKSYSNGSNVDEKENDPIFVMTSTNGDVSAKNSNDSNEIPSIVSNTEKIKEVDKVLNLFESERVSAPSPFTAYMNIKYLIDNIVNKQDAKLAQSLQENCDCLWNKSHQ